jgi:hypothetical protein
VMQCEVWNNTTSFGIQSYTCPILCLSPISSDYTSFNLNMQGTGFLQTVVPSRLHAVMFAVIDILSWFMWSSGQSSCLLTQRSRVRFLALPDFLSSSGSGTGSTQPLWG